MDLQRRVQERMRSWLPYKSRILCAVSGGPDSVALAHFLKAMPYPIILGHVDHALRKNSAADARFVEQLAQRWGLPSRSVRVPVRAQAKTHHQGIEEAA